MLLIIGALSLLSVLTLNVNGTFLMAINTSLEAQAQLNAYSYGQSLMDEILAKSFDEGTVAGNSVFDTDAFTQPKNFGPDAGEMLPGIDSLNHSVDFFDDVDDYHAYTRVIRDSVMDYYTITSQITYTSDQDLDSEVSFRTYLKSITVRVSHPNLPKNESGQVIPVILKEITVSRRYL
jgi:hypothetical protein